MALETVIRLLTLAILGSLHAQAQAVSQEELRVPAWAIRGIALVETRSYWDEAGTFHYVDRRRGAAGEIGPFQMLRVAYEQVRGRGDSFTRMGSDPRYACQMAMRYLQWLRVRSESWEASLAAYNTGLQGSPSTGARYLLMVELAAGLR